MAINSSAKAEAVAAKPEVKNAATFLAVIYDSTIEPRNRRLGARVGRTDMRLPVRPMLTLMSKPKVSIAGAEEGVAKECQLVSLRFGTNLVEDRALWEEVKQQKNVAKMIEDGQLFEIEPESDEWVGLASFSVEDVEILLANTYHQDFVDSFLEGEKRKEVFRMAEQRKLEITKKQEANK